MSDFLLWKLRPQGLIPYFVGVEKVDPERLFGRFCAGLRRSRGISLEDLAAMTGLEPSRLEAIEKGLLAPSDIPTDTLVRLATVLLAAKYRRRIRS